MYHLATKVKKEDKVFIVKYCSARVLQATVCRSEHFKSGNPLQM